MGGNIGMAMTALLSLSALVTNAYAATTWRTLSQTVSGVSCLATFDIDCNWSTQASVTTWNAVFYLTFGVNTRIDDSATKYKATVTFYWGEDSSVTTTEMYEKNASIRLAEQHFYSEAGEYEVGFSLTFGEGAGGCQDKTKYHSVLFRAQDSSCSWVYVIDSNMDSATFDTSSSLSTVASVTTAVFPTPNPFYTNTIGMHQLVDSPFPSVASTPFPTGRPTVVPVAWTAHTTSSTALFISSSSSTPTPIQIEHNPSLATSQATLQIEASVAANTEHHTSLPTTIAQNSNNLTLQPTHQKGLLSAASTQQPTRKYLTSTVASHSFAVSTSANSPSLETTQTSSSSLTSTEIGQHPTHTTFQPVFESETPVSTEPVPTEPPTHVNSLPEFHTVNSQPPTDTAFSYTFASSPTASPTRQTRSRTDELHSDASSGIRTVEQGMMSLHLILPVTIVWSVRSFN